MPERSLSNTCIFSLRHNRAFLHLGTVDNTLALHLGGILNGKITNKKQKYVKNMHQIYYKEDTLTVGELKQEGRMLFCFTSGDHLNWVKILAILSMSASDYKSAMNMGFPKKF